MQRKVSQTHDFWTALAVAPSGHAGRGLFATQPFARGALIARVEGTEKSAPYDSSFEEGGTWFGVGHQRWVEPAADNPGRFLNHSCEPNALMRGGREIVAARDLKAGEEITIDYAETEEDPNWQMECRCGSPKCRRLVRAGKKFEG